ncbi:MAG: flagellar hook capping protein, partial [Lachnospiraceae bacterium]|nr:flagellar hook capping protein [Lachnospiraceae bacterium]
MSLAAPFVDGELVTNTSQIAKKETKTPASANSMDKEAFLQLLVAQMKYQDPLEP